ncbi:MAG TPA: response regulator transcription factor [Flavobacteriales bacterium]|nr:response regulator transcription factor [Flavobacteriales bacterium]
MANPLKIIIVEDEYPIALDTELKLTSKGYMVLGIAKDFASLMNIIGDDTPDVVLLDINLGEGGNGIEIAKKLKRIVAVPFVFLSAYSNPEIVKAALDTEPFGYLVKPYKIEDLVIAIELARTQWMQKLSVSALMQQKKEDEAIFVQSGSKVVRIETREILFLQALDNYSIIQTAKGKTVVSAYLSQLFENFSGNSEFFQVHRSYVINLKNIQSIDGNTAYIDKFEVPISRSNKAELMSRLKLV